MEIQKDNEKGLREKQNKALLFQEKPTIIASLVIFLRLMNGTGNLLINLGIRKQDLYA
jgi:hypothetical protein